MYCMYASMYVFGNKNWIINANMVTMYVYLSVNEANQFWLETKVFAGEDPRNWGHHSPGRMKL